MKQNRKIFGTLLFIVTMSLLGACTRDEHSLWIQSQQAKKEESRQFWKNRTPAQSAPRCFKDRIQDSLIRQEIQQMESAYAQGKRANYQHGDMAFTDLPQATIDALNAGYELSGGMSATRWTQVSPKQKDCRDYACFINSLYEKPTNEGLLHYWYFLKTGYPMSAYPAYPFHGKDGDSINTVKDAALERYLFNQNEWKAFWMEAHLLPKSMLHMPSLNIIHRVPRGHLPASWSGGTCGWAYGSTDGGEILLADNCLRLNPKNTFDLTQSFYDSTTHEIAHRLSAWNFSQADQPASVEMEEAPEFLAFSGWVNDRLVYADGSYMDQWSSRQDQKGWASWYAKTSPAEDFAETVALFRNQAAKLNTLAPEKFQYVKKKVFANRSYTTPDLVKQYPLDVRAGLIDRVDEWLQPCLEGQLPAASMIKPEQVLANLVQIDLPLDAKLKTCIQRQVVSVAVSELERLRYEEPEACLVLENFQTEVATNAIKAALPDLTEYFKTHEALTSLMIGVKDYRQAVTSEFDARALVLACWQKTDAQACYDTKLEAEYQRLYQKYKILLAVSKVDLAEVEQKRFTAIHSYEKTFADVVQFYDGFFAQMGESIQARTDRLWLDCLTVPARANTDVLLSPYHAGNHYVSPAVMQCLNEKLPNEMIEIRSEAGSEKGVNIISTDARTWINERILYPRFRAALDLKVSEAEKSEKLKIELVKQPSIDSLFTALTEETSWKTGAYSYNECKAAVNPRLQATVKPDQYRFLAVDPILDEWGNQVCEKIRAWVVAEANATAAKAKAEAEAAASAAREAPVPVIVVRETPSAQGPVIPTPTQKAELDAIWKSFRPLMIEEAKIRFERCRGRAYFAQKLKRFCLLTEWVVDDQDTYRKTAWNWMKDRATRRWLKLPEVAAWLNSHPGYSDIELYEVARNRAEDERQETTDAILEAFYGVKGTSSTEN